MMCVCVCVFVFVPPRVKCPDVDYIVVPVGGAGLIAGIALAAKALQPEVKVSW